MTTRIGSNVASKALITLGCGLCLVGAGKSVGLDRPLIVTDYKSDLGVIDGDATHLVTFSVTNLRLKPYHVKATGSGCTTATNQTSICRALASSEISYCFNPTSLPTGKGQQIATIHAVGDSETVELHVPFTYEITRKPYAEAKKR